MHSSAHILKSYLLGAEQKVKEIPQNSKDLSHKISCFIDEGIFGWIKVVSSQPIGKPIG